VKEFCQFVEESFFVKVLLVAGVVALYMVARTVGYWDGVGDGLKIGTSRVASGEWVCELMPGKYGETEWQCEKAKE